MNQKDKLDPSPDTIPTTSPRQSQAEGLQVKECQWFEPGEEVERT
jgi:hypothetical protein